MVLGFPLFPKGSAMCLQEEELERSWGEMSPGLIDNLLVKDCSF